MTYAATLDRPAVPPADQAAALRALIDAAQVRQAPVRGADPVRPPTRRALVISIASGKGGVGKTSAAVNLCVALGELGRRVTLVDADPGMANADVLCGISPGTRLDQLVTGRGAARSMAQIAVEAPGGFRLVPGAVGVARMADLDRHERAAVVAGLVEIERDSDVVVVDNGAGVGRGVLAFLNAADLALVVATPEPTSIADAYALIKCVLTQDDAARAADRAHRGMAIGVPKVSLLVNQAAGPAEAAAVHTRIAAVCNRFLGYSLPMAGWVSHDPRVAAAVRERRPLLLASPASPASRDIREVAGTLVRQLRIGGGNGAGVAPRGGLWASLVSRWKGRDG